MSNRLSVIVIAKNEADNIRRCLESVKWVDEIIVLDSGSQDETVAIAKEYTHQVFVTDWQGFGVQKQRALELTTGNWVLNLDADEYVNADLRATIQRVITAEAADGYRIPIRMCFYGKPLRFSSSPTRHVRLFKRAGASFSLDIVHEKIQLPKLARISQINQPIMHHSFRDLTHALNKINLYSSSSARIRIDEKIKSGMAKTLASTCWMFFRCYILQGGFMDGRSGFLFAVMNAQGSWYRGMKQVYPDQISSG